MIKNMSNPGTYKLTVKETKKFNKELQKDMKQELIFKTKQEIKKSSVSLKFLCCSGNQIIIKDFDYNRPPPYNPYH